MRRNMFVLLKMIKPLVLPPTLIFIGMGIALVCLYRRRVRIAKYALLGTLIFYYLLSIEPTAFILTRSLVKDVSRSAILIKTVADNPPEAIVILAGGANPKDEARLLSELSGASWRRLWRGLELYRQLDGKMPILYSGDSGDPFEPPSGEALLARQYAVAMGIPEESFWVETVSRTTAESAVAIRRILDKRFPDHAQHRVILVTSAWHLPRAKKSLEREGIEITPAPADFPTTMKLTLNPLSFVPSIEHFTLSYLAIHEWIGMGAYSVLDALNLSSFDAEKGI